jgi:DNA polymerase-3 subunit gamma/tau
MENMSNQQEEFIVTARKWRPLTFASVVGQEHITNTLKNAVLNNRLHHAFLFCGPRGVGKTTTARILARAVNCTELTSEGEPCNECENCKGVIEGHSFDVIEIDGASNTGVDDVRQLRENAKYPPTLGKYKMYIIDEIHMLSTNAFNALLKILEEPPSHLLFVFATTETSKVLPTIISRCQRYDFRRMELNSIIKQLKTIANKENITIDNQSLLEIAKKADGSMRDSQSIFDQVVAFCGNNIEYKNLADALHLIDEEFFFRISDCIYNNDLKEAFDISSDIINKGYEYSDTLSGLLEHFRNLLTIKATQDTSLIETSNAVREKYVTTANNFSNADLLRYIQIVNQSENTLRFASQPKIKFELAMAQLASMDKMIDIKKLIEEIKKLDEIPINANSTNAPIVQEQIAPTEQFEKKKNN